MKLCPIKKKIAKLIFKQLFTRVEEINEEHLLSKIAFSAYNSWIIAIEIKMLSIPHWPLCPSLDTSYATQRLSIPVQLTQQALCMWDCSFLILSLANYLGPKTIFFSNPAVWTALQTFSMGPWNKYANQLFLQILQSIPELTATSPSSSHPHTTAQWLQRQQTLPFIQSINRLRDIIASPTSFLIHTFTEWHTPSRGCTLLFLLRHTQTLPLTH